MDAECRLEADLLASFDALLSLASLAAACGRPELALAAGAALDPLLPFLADIDGEPATDSFPDPAEDRPHAQH